MLVLAVCMPQSNVLIHISKWFWVINWMHSWLSSIRDISWGRLAWNLTRPKAAWNATDMLCQLMSFNGLKELRCQNNILIDVGHVTLRYNIISIYFCWPKYPPVYLLAPAVDPCVAYPRRSWDDRHNGAPLVWLALGCVSGSTAGRSTWHQVCHLYLVPYVSLHLVPIKARAKLLQFMSD